MGCALPGSQCPSTCHCLPRRALPRCTLPQCGRPSLNTPFPTAPTSHNFFNGIYSTIENSLLLYLIQLHNFLYLIIFVIQKKKLVHLGKCHRKTTVQRTFLFRHVTKPLNLGNSHVIVRM